MADYVVHVGKTIQFVGTGTGGDTRTIVSWEWDFGDGATATGQTVTHTYTSTGLYTVTLTVTNDCGAKATATKTVQVIPLYTVTYDLVKGSNGISVPVQLSMTEYLDLFGTDVEYWGWDPNKQDWIRPDVLGQALEVGKGYILIVASARTVTLEVESLPVLTWDDIVNINGIVVGEIGKEWYLVGCGRDPISVPIENFEVYDAITNQRIADNTLQPWKAYWIKVLPNVCPTPTVDFTVSEA